MGFWKMFGLGHGAPQPDWVGLVGGDAVYDSTTGGVRFWRFPDGDGVGCYFFDREPDLPRVSDLASFVSHTREHVLSSGAALVECDLVAVAGIQAVRQIVKVPQKPSGMTYLGALTLPFAKFSYVFKVQCEERGVTGIREAVLLSQKLAAKTVEIDPVSRGAIKGAWDPDSEEHDERFLDHPLSRLRSHLRSVSCACQVHDALNRHPRFPLPQPTS